MRLLFVHQNFPGQFLHILCRLAAENVHDLVFITEKNDNHISGVRKVTYMLDYDPAEAGAHIHRDAQEFDVAMRRADMVAGVARNLRNLGFVPDMIIGHEGWGEMLNLPDIFPGVPRLGYQEFYYSLNGADVNFDPEFPTHPLDYSRIRAKNAVNLLSLTNGGQGITPTLFQYSTYPDWAQRNITVLHEGVNLDICRPDPSVRQRPFQLGKFTVESQHRLVTYVARDLEPYRGFHTLMRALPAILDADPAIRVIMIGGDGVSYGMRLEGDSWRNHFLREVQSRIDLSRICFAGKLDYGDYLRVLQRSDTHVYLTYPFVASWSLREAMACGCAIVASDTAPVLEFIQPGKTGMLTPCLAPTALADTVLTVLRDNALNQHLRQQARHFAETELRMDTYLQRYQALIAQILARK